MSSLGEFITLFLPGDSRPLSSWGPAQPQGSALGLLTLPGFQAPCAPKPDAAGAFRLPSGAGPFTATATPARVPGQDTSS